MRRQCSREEFEKEIERHTLAIVKEDGVYRHLQARRPNTGIMGFDIITYPGYLCYSGDMGCFVFSRVPDMLTFFRGKPTGPLDINPRYWSEKLQAVDPNGGFQTYSADTFRARIAEELEQFKEHIERDTDRGDMEDEELAEHIEAKFAELKEAVRREVLSKADDGEYAVYAAMRDFEHDDRHWFVDSWEMNLREYTYRFIWCCYAIVWAIRKYDALKAEAASSEQATGTPAAP